MIADAKQVAPSKPFFMYFAPAQCIAASRAKGMGRQIQRQVRRGLGRYRKQVFEKQKQLGIIPKRGSLPPRPGCTGLGCATGRRTRSTPG